MSSTNRGATRNNRDYYPTPQYAIDAILREINWSRVGTMLEPACGDCRIIESAATWNRDMDIDWCEIEKDRDYLAMSWPDTFDLVITNPPYTLAEEYLTKCLLDGESVALLYRLGFLASQKRHQLWQEHVPDRLYVLSQRPSFDGVGTDSADYAWFAWGKAFIRPPGIYAVM